MWYIAKGKIRDLETGKVKQVEILIDGVTFGEVEDKTYKYFEEISPEAKVVSIADAKLREIKDLIGEEKYVVINATWLGLDDEVVTENVAIVADTIQKALAVWDKEVESMPELSLKYYKLMPLNNRNPLTSNTER
mgnify:CR=1 FL=1